MSFRSWRGIGVGGGLRRIEDRFGSGGHANPTTAVAAAAADEVSVALAALPGAHAREYQAAAAQAAFINIACAPIERSDDQARVTEATIATSLRGRWARRPRPFPTGSKRSSMVRFTRPASNGSTAWSARRPPDCQCADKRAARRDLIGNGVTDGGSSNGIPAACYLVTVGPACRR